MTAYGGEQDDSDRHARVMRVRSSRPNARTVLCNDCDKTWRHGCAECVELFADYHRNEFGHSVVVFPPPRENDTWNRRPAGAQRRQWWEARYFDR